MEWKEKRKGTNMKRASKMLMTLGTGVLTASLMFGAAGAPPDSNSNKDTLEGKVRHELLMLPYFNVFDDLSFRVDNGTVTLFGKVTDPVVKRDAASAIKHLEGVARVENQIEVLPLSPFDNRVRLQTYRAIYGYGPLQRYGLGTQPPIRILVKNGHVTLAGIVATEADRNLAFIRANGVPGVFSVTNDLRIER
jgi:hyperosmotically inducible protein